MANHPTQVVAVADGRGIAWDEGVFGGDRALVLACQDAAALGLSARLHPFGDEVTANDTTPSGAAAAMLCAAPGRLMFTMLPAEVREHFPKPGERYDLVLDDLAPQADT